MLYTLRDIVLIPYGIDQWSMSAVTVRGFSDRALQIETPFPLVAVNRASAEPLRLNSQPFELNTAAASDRDVMRQHLHRLCHAWDKPARDFIDGYLHHVERRLEANRPALERKLRPLAGLYCFEDWMFSAPLPLPRAHLFAPGDPTSPVGSEADFVPVDFAFWLGGRFSAALSSQGRSTPAKARERGARLARSGVTTAIFDPDDVSSAADAFFERVACTSQALAHPGRLPVGPLRRSGSGP
jgi:hypothetical protein